MSGIGHAPVEIDLLDQQNLYKQMTKTEECRTNAVVKFANFS